MSRGVNKVILIGRLGNDPDVRSTQTGVVIANISLATNEGWKDKQTGEWQERSEWHRVVFFDRQAEIVQQYLRKGSQIYVEGRLRTNKWQDKNTGQDRYSTEIIAREMQMLGGRADNAGGGYGAPTGGYAQQQPSTNYAAPPPSPPNQGVGQPPPPPPPQPPMNQGMGQQTPPPGMPNTPPDTLDDDVPF